MRVFIPGLLVLAGLWPQGAWGYLEAPPPPLTCSPSSMGPHLVFIRIKDTAAELGTYRVTFSAGPLAEAEAKTQGGQVLFVLDALPLARNCFSITATPEPIEIERNIFEDLDGSITGRPVFSKWVYPVPLAVEVVLLPLITVEWKKMDERPGETAPIPFPSPIAQRFTLGLTVLGQHFLASFLNLEGPVDYCTGGFSMNGPVSEPTDVFAKDSDPSSMTKPWSGLPDRVQLLNGLLCVDKSLGIAITDIQAVGWYKGTARETSWPQPTEARGFYVKFDQEPEFIVLGAYPEPKKPASGDAFRHLNGITIGGVGLDF